MREVPSDIQSILCHPQRRCGIIPNLLLFGRFLRTLGVPVEPSMTIDAARALSIMNVGDKDEFYYTLRANLITKKEELSIFDQAFKIFWETRDILTASDPPSHNAWEINREKEERTDVNATDVIRYSPQEMLSEKDFCRWKEEDMGEMERVISQVLSPLTTRTSRRQRWWRKGSGLHLRKTMRESMRYEGELLHLFRTRRRIKKRRVIFLCDVSGSMDIYTSFILFFIYGLKQVERGAEVFVFSTRLTRVTPLLERYSFPQFLARISEEAPGWSGGTRIGECLKEFNRRHAPSILRPESIFLIYSDGWDRGDPEVLKKELGEIRRRVAEIIWMNPLMGHPAYQPVCQGMKAALPYLDYLLPAYNVASLRRAASVLARS